MPSLGSLWYDVMLKDMTDADLQKINKKLKDLNAGVSITPKLTQSVNDLLPKGLKLELDPQLKALSNDALARAVEGKVMKVEIAPLITNLRKALKDATKTNPPEIEVGVQAVKLRSIIQNVLNRQGFTLNISTVNDNYSKAIQANLNNRRYKVTIHADAKEITRSVQASLMQVQSRYFGLRISRDILYRSIDEALGQKRFNINIAVQQDQARRAVQDALFKAQVMGKDQALAYQRLQAGELKAAQTELTRLKAAHYGAADAAKAHASASISLGGAMGSNIKIAGELGSAMASLYSIHAAKEFLSQVVEIGGELEHQKIAMNTIFGDKGKTNELFGQIKNLARQSPFGVMELTKSVKALSAYGVQYNEIYDTAKRLTDISAATSVDINRLILAFGKTKSRGFLDGLEAKQFAYANIPIYEMVRKKLEELEGQAVTTQEVMERMRKREISFDIVKDVLWDMTDPGGKFYDMQEALAGSVKTSWKLVKDNIELMFGEIADSAIGDSLKSTAEILQSLTREWRTVATVVGTAAAVFGVYRIAQYGANQAISAGTAPLAKRLQLETAQNRAYLRSISLQRELLAEEQMMIASHKKIDTALLSRYVGQNKLNASQLTELYLSRQIDKEQIKHLLRVGQIDKATAKAILSNNRYMVSLRGIGMALKSVGVAMKTLLLSPWTAIFAAVEGVIFAWQRSNEQQEKAEEIGRNVFTKATEGAKSLSKAVEEIKAPEGLSDIELTRGIEAMENAIKDYSATPIKDINESLVAQDGHVLTLTERYEVLKKKVDDLLESYKQIEQTNRNGDKDQIITPAIEKTNAWWKDGLLENAKEYSEELDKVEDFISKKLSSDREKIQKFIKWAKSVSPEFKAAAKDLNLNAAYKELVLNPEKYQDVYSNKRGAYYIKNLTSGFKEEKETFLNDLNDFIAEARQRIKTDWNVDNVDDLTDEQKNALVVRLNAMINGAEGVSERVKQEWRDILADVFKISFDPAVDVTPMIQDELLKNLDSYVDKKLADDIRKGIDISNKSGNFEALKIAIKDAAGFIYGGVDSATKEAINEAISDANISQTTGLIIHALQNKRSSTTETPDDNRKDTFAESLKQRFKDIKDAWNEFQKWSKTEGRDAAAKRIGESGIFSTLSADEIPKTIEDYRALVEKIKAELQQAGVKGTARKSLLNELLKQLLAIDNTVVDEQLKLTLDKVSKEAERQLADWNLFDKIRKATGNQGLAMNIAFGMNATAETDYPAMIKQQLQKTVEAAESALSKAIPKEGESPYKVQGYTYDKLKELYDARDTDKGMQEWVAVPEDIRKAWEKANGDILKYFDQQRESVANILNEYQTLQDKLAKIDADRQRKIETVQKSGMSAPEKAQYIQRIKVEADWQKFTQGADYLRFFSGIYSLTMEQAQQIGDKIRLHLDKRLQAGKISAEDYYKEIERINQQLAKLRNVKSDALTFLTGGVKGVQQNRLEKTDSDVLAQMTKVQEAQEALEKAKASGDIKQIAAADLTLKIAQQELDTRLKIRDAIIKDMEGWQKVLDVVNIAGSIAGGMSDAFNSIREMADALGVDTESGAWDDIAAVMDTLTAVTGGVQKVVQSAMSGDIGGILSGAVSTITTPFTIWSKLHDKKLQKMIDRSKQAAQIMQNQYDILEKRMASFLGNAANMKVEGYSGEGGAYGKQLELMKGQLAELEKQRQAEIKKKKTDKSVVADYDKQIEEMKISIRDFAEETAKDLYGIDLKGWAQQIGDALVDAFAKGEDAAEAFDKTVADIMRSVVKSIIATEVIAPAMEHLRDYLFGENGVFANYETGGDFKLSAQDSVGLANMLNGLKDRIGASQEIWDLINDSLGGLLDDTEKAKNGLSAGIQSVTEDTADLLASYINAIRASVAMNEGRWERLLGESLPQISVIAQSQLDAQRQIAENTLRSAKAAEAIMKSNDEINRRLARVTQGAEKIHVN